MDIDTLYGKQPLAVEYAVRISDQSKWWWRPFEWLGRIWKYLLFAVLAVLLWIPTAHAAGTVTSACAQIGTSGVWTVTYSWTGDSSSGTVPATAAPCLVSNAQLQGMRVFQVETVPGSPSPTASYVVTLKDAAGVDWLAGQTNALSATAAAMWQVTAPALSGTLTLAVTSQSVASAQGSVVVYLAPGAIAKVQSNAAGGPIVGSTGTFSGNVAVGGTQLDPVKGINAPDHADVASFAGADMGAKINACFGSGATICDARTLTGAQAAAATIVGPADKKLILAGVTLTASGTPGISYARGFSVSGLGSDGTSIIGTVASATPASRTYNLQLSGLSITSSASVTLDLTNHTFGRFFDVNITGPNTGTCLLITGAAYYNEFYASVLSSGCLIGLDIDAGANENKVFGGRISAATGVRIGHTSNTNHNVLSGVAFEGCTTDNIFFDKFSIANGVVSPRLESTGIPFATQFNDSNSSLNYLLAPYSETGTAIVDVGGRLSALNAFGGQWSSPSGIFSNGAALGPTHALALRIYTTSSASPAATDLGAIWLTGTQFALADWNTGVKGISIDTSSGNVTISNGSASSVVCWKSDGKSIGYATVAEITAGTCH